MQAAEAQCPDRRKGAILGLTSIAYFMVVLDSVVVVTALPRMQRDLHAGLGALQWTLNAYGITFAAAIVAAAALGDRLGRRRVFTAGLALFSLASAACALAPTVGALIAARALQGLGGATVLPLSLTILTTSFPPQRRGAIVGIYGGLAGLAVATGPIIGGALAQEIDWHWIFWVNVPIGALAVALGRLLLPESRGPAERLDLVGTALLSAGALALVWALSRAGAAGWSSAEVVVTMIAGAALLLAFLRWERSAPAPLLPLRLLARRDFAIGNLSSFLMSGAIFASALLVTEEFQLARHLSPVGAGLRLLPFFATPALISPLAGALSDRIGPRPLAASGLLMLTAGLGWVAWRGSLSSSWVELVVALLVAGTGVSMALPTLPAAVLGAVSAQEAGKASGLNYMAQRFGAAFAVALSGAIFAGYGNLRSPAAVTAGFRPAIFVCAMLAALGAITCIGLSRRRAPELNHGPDVNDPPLAPSASLAE